MIRTTPLNFHGRVPLPVCGLRAGCGLLGPEAGAPVIGCAVLLRAERRKSGSGDPLLHASWLHSPNSFKGIKVKYSF